jgi:SAM-dependent methyltransferase
MTWFKDHLYVGTTRANIHLVWFRMGENVKRFQAWPVELPSKPWDLDLRAQIWRYNPKTENWQKVFISPMIMGKDGFEVPMSIGFRGMTSFQGQSDPSPALYIPTWSSSKGPGPVLLRSVDGTTFEQVSKPGLGDPMASTLRSIVSFKGKLFISPTGTARGQFSGNVPDKPLILVGTDPLKGRWQLACEPHLGDRTNLGIFDMATFNGHLYAGTFNATGGCQVWKTDAEGDPPYKWIKVLSDGGYRGNKNEATTHMVEFNGKLYVGTGLIAGYDRVRNIGPASPELFCLYPDDSWQLIVGEPRLTPEGMKVPLSGWGPGFNSPTVGYFWRLCVHEGWFYLGTYDSIVWMPYIHSGEWPDFLSELFGRASIDDIVRKRAGFDLWRSRDGVYWVPVTRNGFGNPCNYGVRTMASTPYGLFIGAANPFAPTMAIRRLSGWHYETNPSGGLEIWLGSKDSCTSSSRVLSAGGGREAVNRSAKRWKDLAALREKLIGDYYGDSDFRHCGLWRYPINTPREACENLVKELLSFIPEKKGRLLEIGCDRGATTRTIVRHLQSDSVTGIVGTKEELEACRKNAPTVRCRVMEPPRLKFKGKSFDCVICIEGPGSFGPGVRLFREVYRILKPSGRLVFSDIIFDTGARVNGIGKIKNVANSPEEYRELLATCGFEDTQIFDATQSCWKAFHRHYWNDFGLRLLSGKISLDLFREILSHLPTGGLPVSYYVIGSLKKGSEAHKRH